MAYTKTKEIEIGADYFLKRDCVWSYEIPNTSFLLHVYRDEYVESPRNPNYNDNLWTWVTTEKAGYSDKELQTNRDTGKPEWARLNLDDYPIYTHDFWNGFLDKHFVKMLILRRQSGDRVAIGDNFTASFDSGVMGFAFVSKEKARKDFPTLTDEAELFEEALRQLKGEVKMMNMYLDGDVYIFNATDMHTEDTDSCTDCYCENSRELIDQLVDFSGWKSYIPDMNVLYNYGKFNY
jgi:hypothetical protein